jgi:protein arginine kinase activator
VLDQPCRLCNKKPAVVKITKINKGSYLELFLCQECAAKESSVQKKMVNKNNLQELLSNLLKNKIESAAKVKGGKLAPELICPTCGHTLPQYVESALLGCPDCYAAFEERLIKDIRKFHGNTSHSGKKPEHYSPMEPAWARIKAMIKERKEEEAIKPKMAEFADPEETAGMIDEIEQLEQSEEPNDNDLNTYEKIEKLQRELKTATDEENFHRAAQLRDRIKELEKELH